MMLLTALSYAADEVCTAWGEATSVEFAEVGNGESSGLVVWDDLAFTMDDADGATSLYAMYLTGTYIGAQEVGGATNTDWEDLGLGPCPDAVDADVCLYIADIGDNTESRESLMLWVYPAGPDARVTATACPIAYDDGEARDAETLLVTADGAVRIVTKESDGEAKIYRTSALSCGASPDPLTREAELQLDGPATGGAVRADGAQLAIRTATTAYLWSDCALDWANPTVLPLPAEDQGEGIAIGPDGALILTSEGDPLQIDTLACTATEACSACGCTSGAPGGGLSLLIAMFAGRRARSAPSARRPTQ
jgi:hypothetical protein